ncbi:hypothetical protein KC887_02000 [Candidatus Kaiserbacteria bacterium]|nr:hypothetical protein [Candidatus Kaiserbacteria bacterium]
MELFKHQNETADFVAGNPVTLCTSDPGCVSNDTEYLTPTGWKRMDRYTEGDKVAQFHPDTRRIEFVTPTEYVVKDCPLMLHLKTARGVDQMLSPEHRVLYYTEGNPDRYEVIPAAALKELHDTLTIGFRGRFENTFTVDTPGIPFTDDEIRLGVAIKADGYVVKQLHGYKVSMNLKKERKKQRLEVLLANCGVEYTIHKSAPGYSRYHFTPPCPEKRYTEYWGASAHQRAIIVDEAQYWDGSQCRAGAYTFHTTHAEDADFIQFCAASTGRTSSIQTYTRYRRGRTETDYVVHIRKNAARVGIKSGSNKSEIPIVPSPDGKKYCFMVPSTFLLLRRNGHIFATGNTGKTISVIEGFIRRKAKKMLVLAPLSILRPAWGDDITKFAPHLTWAIAHGSKRVDAINGDADIVISNHDSVKWMAKLPKDTWDKYDMICIDEFTAFKNRTAQRSKAALAVIRNFECRVILSGTPNSNTICDLWHPIFMLDGGKRLGPQFFRFRSQVCTPVQVGPSSMMVKWEDKPGAEQMVADILADITVRHKFEDCLDIPENTTRYMYVDLPTKLRKQYEELSYNSFLELEKGTISAIHAGAKTKKLLQLLSGAVYDEQGNVVNAHEDRHQLVMELVAERKKSVVAFNWKHERDALIKLAESAGIKYAVIDGSVSTNDREIAVKRFQLGDLQVIFAHPQSAGHGLTLTAGSATIWCSPTYNAEHFQQFNRRIYRAGQRKQTETILIAARDTKEEEVYEKLSGKLQRMEDLLSIFANFTKLSEAS